MKLSSIRKSTFREIAGSFGRFAAILAIVALGVGLFAGLKVTRTAMVRTTEQYFEKNSFYDYRLLSTMGFEQEDVDFLKNNEDVQAAEGALSFDILYQNEEGNEGVIKAHSITENVNTIGLIEGRMPENPAECLVDVNAFASSSIGKVIRLSEGNTQEDLEHFAYREYTIVGVIQSPLYIQFERGNTSLGTGKISGFMYLLPQGFAEEYFTEVYVKLTENFLLYSQEYDDFMETKEAKWEELTKEAAGGRYERILGEAEEELADAEKELEDKRLEGEKELADAKAELTEAKEKLDEGAQELADAKAELADARQTIADKEAELADAKQTIADKETELANAGKEVADGWAEWNSRKQELDNSKSTLESAEAQLNAKKEELAGQEAAFLAGAAAMTDEEVAAFKAAIEQGKLTIAAYEQELNMGKGQVAQGETALNTAYMELAGAENQVTEGKTALEQAKAELSEGEVKLADAKKELAEGEETLKEKEAEYQDGLQEYEEGLSDYEEGEEEFNSKIAEAEEKIADARKELDEIEEPDTYVLGRNTNVGYVCFENDSAIVEGIANIFPVFFFLVAALVCITTMNRMVEEQRTQIGVLKALGYGEGLIMFKYMFYSGLAAFTGSLIGFLGGTRLFPWVIWIVYGMMYRVDTLVYVFDWKLAFISLAVALLCSMGTTWLSCRMELSQVAAQLMRPKAPKAGKRVFLEYLPFIWKRLGFLKKVSVRNIFRYKKRLFMMVMGISGCTALLVTGFGIKDSIANVAAQQFEEIQVYDIAVTFSDSVDEETEAEFKEAAGADISEYLPAMETSQDIVTDNGQKSVNLVVLEAGEESEAFLKLHTKGGETIAYPAAGEAVITDKIAAQLGIEPGDDLTLRDENMQTMTMKVVGINRNFIYNYVYINSETYEQQTGQTPEYKTVYINAAEEADLHGLSARLMKLSTVASVSVNQDIMERISNMMESLDLIVVVIIVCAAGLAFIVLYNLTNINITERIREIATIKVLGFYKRETSNYVFRENLVLTFIGAFVGLPLGTWLHSFVMNQINLDMIAFDIHIVPLSYIYSVALTFVFAMVINLFMGRKLEKISMTESLKSVD